MEAKRGDKMVEIVGRRRRGDIGPWFSGMVGGGRTYLCGMLL